MRMLHRTLNLECRILPIGYGLIYDLQHLWSALSISCKLSHWCVMIASWLNCMAMQHSLFSSFSLPNASLLPCLELWMQRSFWAMILSRCWPRSLLCQNSAACTSRTILCWRTSSSAGSAWWPNLPVWHTWMTVLCLSLKESVQKPGKPLLVKFSFVSCNSPRVSSDFHIPRRLCISAE